jgi:hypothetical protein
MKYPAQVLLLNLLLLILCRLLNSVSLAGSDNLLVGVECKGEYSMLFLLPRVKYIEKYLQLVHLITNLSANQSYYTINIVSIESPHPWQLHNLHILSFCIDLTSLRTRSCFPSVMHIQSSPTIRFLW